MSEQTEQRPNPRKVREGLVVSTSMDKTAVVEVSRKVPHPIYKKYIIKSTNLYLTPTGEEMSGGFMNDKDMNR